MIGDIYHELYIKKYYKDNPYELALLCIQLANLYGGDDDNLRICSHKDLMITITKRIVKREGHVIDDTPLWLYIFGKRRKEVKEYIYFHTFLVEVQRTINYGFKELFHVVYCPNYCKSGEKYNLPIVCIEEFSRSHFDSFDNEWILDIVKWIYMPNMKRENKE